MSNTPEIKQKKSTKHPGGRPTVMTPDVIAKLEQAFAIDASVEEACSYAEISRNSFYDYLKVNPEFSNRIEDLRQRPVLKARQTIVKGLDDSSNAKWYLEKKKKKEFSNSLELSGNLTISQVLDQLENGHEAEGQELENK